MSLNITLSATERANVQANALTYFESQEYLDDQQASLDTMLLLECQYKANLISQWCSSNNYKNTSHSSSFSVNVGLIDGNILSTWETDLTSQGYLVSYSGTGNIPPGCVNGPGCIFGVDLTLEISLP